MATETSLRSVKISERNLDLTGIISQNTELLSPKARVWKGIKVARPSRERSYRLNE
jgi:hypothetical protein